MILTKIIMESLTNYQRKVFSIIQSLQYNLFTDYEEEFTDENARRIIAFYLICYTERNPQKRRQIYLQMKSEIQDQAELKILKWFQKQRGQKYLGESLPLAEIRKKFKYIEICQNSDFLVQTRIIGLSQNIPVQQKLSLDPIQISQSVFMILIQPQYEKEFLFRKVKQRQQRSTPWIVQKTKDHRYIWRATTGIDRYDLTNLLTFLLLKRSKNDQCPSIFINTGSHGDVLGNIASDVGDFRLTAKFIWDETINTLYEMIEKYGHKLRLNKANIKTKVCINFMSSSYPSVYPDQADHIIDTQCFGAYRSIRAQRLHPPGTFVKEEDLMFLEGRLEAEVEQYKTAQQQFLNKSPPEKKPESVMKNTVITEPMKMLLSQSAIIRKQSDAYTLINFFHFTYIKNPQKDEKVYKKLKDLSLLYRASQHDFDISEYFQTCGSQIYTFFLCLTEKDKIVGAFSPYSHEYNQFTDKNDQDEELQQVEDAQRDSFIFSVTNNEAFGLFLIDKAVLRDRDKERIMFGCLDFSICDKANMVKESIAINNIAYYNPNYQVPENIEDCKQNYVRFNGNEEPKFLVKEWEVWKIQLEDCNEDQ